MVWGAVKFVVKTARVYRVKQLPFRPLLFIIYYYYYYLLLLFIFILAGENLSFISNVFQILQNNWLPWELSKMSKFGHVTPF